MACRTGVVRGDALLEYSFPSPHPFNKSRVQRFWEELDNNDSVPKGRSVEIPPERADEALLQLFHARGHVEFVRKASVLGYGSLDQGDTPAFPGVFEAAQSVVGSTVSCVEKVLEGELSHAFNPVGGLHHARRDASAGFCVFNDIAVAIELLRKRGVARILYVDIDVHHGDGVYYSYEEDPDVFIFDVHEDGRFLYPGTGREDEIGKGPASGTKVNVPLPPGAGDEQLLTLIPRLQDLASRCRPEFIIFQCGADAMSGDPLGGLAYSQRAYDEIAKVLHHAAHSQGHGRLVGLGGGGYSPENCAKAWAAVVNALSTTK